MRRMRFMVSSLCRSVALPTAKVCLVPLLTVARAFTTHHHPHDSPYNSAALARSGGSGQPRWILAAVTGPYHILVTVSAVTAGHRAPRPDRPESGQAAAVAGERSRTGMNETTTEPR
jgi:hypothetical protein